MHRIWFLPLFLVSFGVNGGQCKADSPQTTTALVELYTSEGCDSCPPADRWLSSLGRRGYAPDRVVPVALHVDYWDYIGWKDPYARQAHAARQRKMAQLARAAVVYTPQVLLQGQDFRAWREGGIAAGTPGPFEAAVAKINARPAKARISLSLDLTRAAGGREAVFEVKAAAELADASPAPDIGLYLGAYENKLVSEVKAGENRGRILPHDYVVLQWVGPLEFKVGKLSVRHTLALLPKAVPAHSGVVAFVQNRANAEVLQALMLPACQG